MNSVSTAAKGVVGASQAAIEVILERGHRVAHWLAKSHGFTRVYVGGAPVAGLGSPRSDIDIFVVLSGGEPMPTAQLEFEGQRVDVEYVQDKTLAGAVELACTFVSSSIDPLQLAKATRSWLDQLARFILGEVIIDDGTLGELHERMSSHLSDFTRLVIARHAQDIQNLEEDVDGALANGDLFCADYQSREIVYRGMEAILCAEGDFYLSTKWLGAKWARTIHDPLLQSLGDLLVDMSLPDRKEAVRRNRWLGQNLIALASTGFRDAPDLDGTTIGVTRDSTYSLLPLSDGYFATRETGRGIQLSRQGVLLWMLAHKRDRDEAVALTSEQLAADGSPVERHDIAAYYDSLVASGLLVTTRDAPGAPQ